MKKLTLALLFAAAVGATPATASDLIKIGQLGCSVADVGNHILVSYKTLGCEYTSIDGSTERYDGSVEKFGLDLGKADRTDLIWWVFAPTRSVPNGALNGTYVGASAEATVGVGAGANVLVGGFENSISLQPVNIQLQTGLNIAAGVSRFTLQAAN
ncbi:DUF992 domain-containing protein [Nitratireductor sp. XY-223]|uniref:DUF992 domain-containing protein n=1 Tax=Nitratireductor sp. XY-223 TaxID=2561926 RepID=UPI0010AA6504|nr:DUF992 domain-containing protein [Nitratireductor sp. XY-223]